MFEPDTTGKCPHCRTSARFIKAEAKDWEGKRDAYIDSMMFARGDEECLMIFSSVCPECHKPIAVLQRRRKGEPAIREEIAVYPLNVVRTAPSEVPTSISEDFLEAAAVLSISEKASAALSRRCLQNVLKDQGYTQRDLNDQIVAALKALPTRIGENLDAIRNIGNFAAHPMKSNTTGMIIDVEPEEANWNLDVLEELFDYYYVQPKRAEEKRKRLNAKLAELGKPPLRKP